MTRSENWRQLTVVANEDKPFRTQHAHNRERQRNLAGFIKDDRIKLNAMQALCTCSKRRRANNIGAGELSQRLTLEGLIVFDPEVVGARRAADFDCRDRRGILA